MKEHSILEDFLNLLYPVYCIICGEHTENSYPLCNECIKNIEMVKFPYCNICGKPMDNMGISICRECKKSPPVFKMARFGYFYRGVLREVIHSWKYDSIRSFSYFLGEMIVKAILLSDIPVSTIDYVGFVPISGKKFLKRGFNQAKDLAVFVSKKFNIPIFTQLRVVKDLEDQTKFTRKERFKNIKGAYSVSEDKRYDNKKILIIDDVYTTGATISEIAKVLNHRGFEIYIFTLARGIQ